MDDGNVQQISILDCRNNPNSESLCDVLKCCLIKFVLQGADKVLKDGKSRKSNAVVNGPREHPLSLSAENVNLTLQGNNRKTSNKDSVNGVDRWRIEYVDVPEAVKPSSGSNAEFPYNFLALCAVILMRCVMFQFNILVTFVTFPIWLAYFSVMFLMFPFQVLKHIRGYLCNKLFRMWDSSSKTVTMKVQKSMVSFGCALFQSFYVCSMLFGLLVSGFLFGGFLMRHLVEKPIQTIETLNFDYTKPCPVAFVPLMSSPGLADPSGLIANHDKQVQDRVIPYNHKLQVTVSLQLPESEYNRKLGVFQVRVELLSANGKVTARSSYPCLLRFKSQPIRFVETFIKTVPLLTGFISESQVLNIKMNELTEGLDPTAFLKVVLEQRMEYKPAGAGVPEVYSALLTLESELPQLKRMIWCWRRTIFVWASIMWFLMELVLILLVCRPIIIPRGTPSIVCYKKRIH